MYLYMYLYQPLGIGLTTVHVACQRTVSVHATWHSATIDFRVNGEELETSLDHVTFVHA